MPMKITNLGKLPIEQKGKLPSDENKNKNHKGKLPSQKRKFPTGSYDKQYFVGHKFRVIITDFADTYTCNFESQNWRPLTSKLENSKLSGNTVKKFPNFIRTVDCHRMT